MVEHPKSKSMEVLTILMGHPVVGSHQPYLNPYVGTLVKVWQSMIRSHLITGENTQLRVRGKAANYLTQPYPFTEHDPPF